MTWKDIQHPEVARIDRVAEIFEIWAGPGLPFAKFKIKVIERAGKQFLAVPSVAILNPATREPEWVSGLGQSVEDALQDALNYLMKEIKQHAPSRDLTEEDFAWTAPEDF